MRTLLEMIPGDRLNVLGEPPGFRDAADHKPAFGLGRGPVLTELLQVTVLPYVAVTAAPTGSGRSSDSSLTHLWMVARRRTSAVCI